MKWYHIAWRNQYQKMLSLVYSETVGVWRTMCAHGRSFQTQGSETAEPCVPWVIVLILDTNRSLCVDEWILHRPIGLLGITVSADPGPRPPPWRRWSAGLRARTVHVFRSFVQSCRSRLSWSAGTDLWACGPRRLYEGRQWCKHQVVIVTSTSAIDWVPGFKCILESSIFSL